jgi:hypothetical protein
MPISFPNEFVFAPYTLFPLSRVPALPPPAPLSRNLCSLSLCFPAELSTGLVGLDVVPNAREVLAKLYARTLEDVKVIPAGVPYREQVEKLTKYRLQVVQANEDVRVVLLLFFARARARRGAAAAHPFTHPLLLPPFLSRSAPLKRK